jgi:inhibitor of cysteine peptidase
LTPEAKSKTESELQNRLKDYLKKHMRDLEKTDIARINLKNFNQTAVGTLPGHLLNQFSLDEYQNNLRAAVTISSRNFGGSNLDSTNEVYVLSPSMEIMGKVINLGDSERIYSVRFMSDRGFVVTFRETDPFYVLDLTDPKNPVAKGELKIPGYSSYLHPLSTNHILGVGKEGSQVKLSLFDVSNAAAPVELSKYTLDEYWSEALNNHRAFMYDAKYGLIFIPASKGGYLLTLKDNILALGKVIDVQNTKRALFIGDNLYILGDTGLKVVSESTLETLKSLTF